jgi:hypothetical protein
MAQVTWSILAIDKTRAAFASVNQGLRGIQRNTDNLGKRLAAGIIGGGMFALLGREVRDVAQDIENIPGVPPDTIQSVKDMNAAFTESRNLARGAIADMLGTFATAAKSIGATLGAIDWKAFINPMSTAAAIGTAQATVVAALEDETQQYIKTLQQQQATELSAARATKEAKAALESKNKELKAAEALARKMIDAQDFFAKSERDYRQQLEQTGETIRKSVRTPMEEYSETVAEMRTLFNRGAIDAQTFSRAVGKANDELLQTKDRGREASKAATELGWAFASSFEDAILEGAKLSDVLRGLAKDIARILIRNLITEPLAASITSGVKGMFGGGKAVGGAVSAGTTYLVGENGPELFTSSSAGRIIPNHNLNQGASVGGDSFVFNYSFPMGVTKAELIPALKATKDATIAAIRDLNARRPARQAYA